MRRLKYKIKNGKKLSKRDTGQKKKTAAGGKSTCTQCHTFVFSSKEKGITHYQMLTFIIIIYNNSSMKQTRKVSHGCGHWQ